ncbi:cobyrinic acid a,c-diamide synthase [Thiothrix eikelboomii]|uniref:Cobyrinic acid a,c-diamide synthase n=1 Tax=Thiothrix eikelboomii TaxID=92487 RepID=A0A1T4XI10_9GAMM|nr:cobyrinate a,c-diamide synthase [Thiothrix eikelboomii]SKA89189.1 cobyrinic acid a,c-diamide synthase [Thiothrix eikelboomii]
MARLFISAAHKSSGKTTLSIGLCAAWQQQGWQVQPFKKGPDYIDPLWLTAASQRHCHNLDFNTSSEHELLHCVQQYGHTADLSLIEANKGLYDGLSLDGSDSNAALAKLLQAPVILVIDTRGMTRGIVPLLLGHVAFDREVKIAGVIFNRVGGSRHATKLRQAVEHFTDLAVLGVVQESAELQIEERHLGLMPSNERLDAEQQIARMRALVTDQVDLAQLISIAQQAPQLPTRIQPPLFKNSLHSSTKLRIGICQDAAFGFYYPGDLEALQQAGAELITINTLQDTQLPDLDGLFIGGGFPETQMQQLAANRSMRLSIRAAIEAGLPTYAECGGLMYLARSLQWNNQHAEMVGIIPGDAVMYPKPQGRGYVQLEETAAMLWPNNGVGSELVQAHEFHYSRLENLTVTGQGQYAYKVKRGQGIDGEHDGWVYKNLLASYTHLRHTHRYPWAQRFMEFVRKQANQRKQAA